MCRETKRIILKTLTTTGAGASVPSSENHQDGSWNSGDIYKGEMLFNSTDSILYSRSEEGIGSVFFPFGFLKGILNQSSQNAPVLNSYVNTIGNITIGRTSTGVYTITRTGAFPENRTLIKVGTHKDITHRFIVYRVDDNTIAIKTYVSTTLTDGLLNEFSIDIEILPSTPIS